MILKMTPCEEEGRYCYFPQHHVTRFTPQIDHAFNHEGRANCLIDPVGDPWFSPWPEYGLEPWDTADEPGNCKAGFWTDELIAKYLEQSKARRRLEGR